MPERRPKSGEADVAKPDYPATRTGNDCSILAGLSFPDPYRWLEAESDEVRDWQRIQAELARAHVREWPGFDRLRLLVARCHMASHVELPMFAGGRWFRIDGASLKRAVVSDTPFGAGRALFDPEGAAEKQPAILCWISPSPDGRTLAIGVSVNGSENNTMRLIDVPTAEMLPDPPPHVLMDWVTGAAQWLPDSSGFFFTALTGRASDFDLQVHLHRRTPVPSTVPIDIQWESEKEFRKVIVSKDGRHAVAFERYLSPVPIAIASLEEPALRWRPFVRSFEGSLVGQIAGDRYIAICDLGAPRGRLVSIPLESADAANPATWQELVPESDAILRSVFPIGDVLYVSELCEGYARVRIVDLSGRVLGEVPLPGRGAIVTEGAIVCLSLAPRSHGSRFLFGFSSLTCSTGIYSHTPGVQTIETLIEPAVRLTDVVVEEHSARSADGTLIPYHLVRPVRRDATQPQPTLIYAYGGYNVALVPQFPGAMAAFIAAGGTFVHAHLRGGGEFGREWWNGGRMAHKQHCYDDLYCIAEDLIASKRTIPQKLAVTGVSNGGLMAGVALTQRPDLWGVVIPRIPVLDLIGGCRDGYIRMAIAIEYADIDDPAQVTRMASYSPYELVREGVRYPAVFFDVGGADPRCPPWHGRKLAARLQRATAGGGPILLHVWDNVGHGTLDRDTEIAQYTEWLAFALRHLGVAHID